MGVELSIKRIAARVLCFAIAPTRLGLRAGSSAPRPPPSPPRLYHARLGGGAWRRLLPLSHLLSLSPSELPAEGGLAADPFLIPCCGVVLSRRAALKARLFFF
ncbi:hypothetical protein GUJ93_ZPchr0003g16768 [Zizania palustris]|uniref:Uncharacterized protein n=1 Tax=Zizania palustris TaxID=103762 RepID=A0A8J5RME5_ZIZPA|nr:hypothetical protein GUJ93_ZPchr0003g16768 [Zizania palustris]